MLKHSWILIVALLVVLALPMGVVADSYSVSMPHTDYDPLSGDGLAANSWCRLGQVVDIPGRYVTSIGYKVWAIGKPTGDITLSIYNVTGPVIFSKIWGDASNLTAWGSRASAIWVALDEPVCINATVRICVEYYGGDMDNYCGAGYYAGDRITGEYYTNYRYGQWHDIGEAEEGSYFYAWVDPEDLIPESPAIPLWPIAPLGAAIVGLWFYVNKRRHKKHEDN